MKCIYGLLFLFCIWLLLPVQNKLADMPLSFALYDRGDQLLGARIASDEQWRFEALDSVPYKFEKALLAFEDKNFYNHFGVDFKAVLRAMHLNVQERRVVSGASTLSMQLMRLHNTRARRTLIRKIGEVMRALKYECHYSKEEILLMYITHAPFGGNIVGLEAASWRYLGKSPHQLSWAESCMLAVLPNAPSLINLSKNRDKLLSKRNKLLEKLYVLDIIDEVEYNLAVLEPIAPKPQRLPNLATHFLEHVRHNSDSNHFDSSLDYEKQQLLNEVVDMHHLINHQKGIYNLGAVVVNNYTNSIEAYVGNTNGRLNENANNMIESARSSGSILKPILYALALEDGLIAPDGLAMDVPLSIGGFSPKNYSRTYAGVETYSNVIAKSLNVPSVTLLQKYGIKRFLTNLRTLGFSTLNYSEDYYGLPLILGGGEVSLIDLVGAYSGMARILHTYTQNSSRYEEDPFKKPSFSIDNQKHEGKLGYEAHLLSAGSVWATLKAMKKVVRPNAEGQWERFENARPVHWKTGTSYGNKDAWAIGVTPKYTVGVWVGNSNGTPQPDIIGASSAGSVMFDIFNFLDISTQFEVPFDDMKEVDLCSHSGQMASKHCHTRKSDWLPSTCISNQICAYCKPALIDESNGLLVYRDCAVSHSVKDTSYFILPPLAAHYYKLSNPTYQGMPPFHPSCQDYTKQESQMAFEYPREDVSVFIPIDLSGVKEKCVFKAQHKNQEALMYWHLNDRYLGSTSEIHHMAVAVNAGEYKLTIQDELGHEVSQMVTVVSN